MGNEKLNECIDKFTIIGEEEKQLYLDESTVKYGYPPKKGVTGEDTYYLDKMNEQMEMLKDLRKNFSNNKDFYSYCSKMFAKAYIPLMIQEYKITDDKVLNTLMNIANGDGIKIFEPGEAKEYVNSKGKEFNGSGDAFRFEDSICFTPDLNKDEKLSEEMKSIVNANRMLGMMIHETTHILYDVTKYEHFNYSNLSELTSGGSVLNEGIVEMHALDFAKKYNLPTLPSIMYMNVVEMARTLKEMHGPEKFEELCLSGTYEDLVPSELLEKFKTNERIRYFSKDGYKVDPSLINLSEEKSREL